MRVNMDSSIATDPRFKMVAKHLGVSWREVVGSAFLVWLTCYERRSATLRRIEIDIAAEVDGFADALCKFALADAENDELVHIHGVVARIKFLERQKRLGARGGENRAKSATSKRSLAENEANATAGPQAYPPALALAPALSPALAHSALARAASEGLNLEAFLEAIANAGIAIVLGESDKARFSKLYPVGRDELAYALGEAARAKAKRPGYVLTVLEDQRQKASAVPDQPPAKKPKMTPDRTGETPEERRERLLTETKRS